MKYTIKSGDFSATVDSNGAGLTSVMLKGKEYLWQADPAYWAGQAPLMFPLCGCLRDGKGTLANGKPIELGRHGFARRREFTVTEVTDSSVTMELVSDDATREVFPLDFKLVMKFEAVDNKVVINHIVTNTGDETLPYFVGGHPAFFCPFHEDEVFEDYIVEMECEEYANCPTIRDDGICDVSARTLYFDNTNILKVRHDLFYQDAVCLEYPKSTWAILRHKDKTEGVKVEFEGFNFFQIWSSANNGPFVALEPWTGTATTSEEDDVFEHKRGVKLLEPGKTENSAYSIGIVE